MEKEAKISEKILYCIICGTKLTDRQVKRGITTCCRSCVNIKRYRNQSERDKQALAMKNKWKSPGYHERLSKSHSESRKFLWTTEEYRSNVIAAINTPEARLKKVTNEKRTLARPEVKKRHLESKKAFWADTEKANAALHKRHLTCKKTGVYRTSKEEDKAFIGLQSKYKMIERQKPYPTKPNLHCDFYLQELDLYIECHFDWTHGKVPYDSKDLQCQEQLKYWQEKAKSSKYYKNAIYTWTDLDVRKRQCAEDNKLNWICFYSSNDFERWLNGK